MHWLERWRALARRIDGLLQAGEYLNSAFRINANDIFNVIGKSIKPELKEVNAEIKALLTDHQPELPEDTARVARAYLDGAWNAENLTAGVANLQVLAPIGVFRAQFDYFVRDTEVEARSLIELAFEHLRRRITVDKPHAKQWQNAFAKNEPQCERLGAVHLLSHGIWAFKVDALGAATDLVCGEPLANEIATIERSARTLALTEWKLIRGVSELRPKAAQARAQAQIYASTVLRTIELKRTRYLVLVSERGLTPPDDVVEKGITYRHIVVPVDPSSPSQTARRTGST
jgi:hypothetical protein